MLGEKRIRTVLGEDKRLIQIQCFPCVHFLAEEFFRDGDIVPAAHVPSVVAVQSDDIAELEALAFIGSGVHYHGKGARTFLRIQCARSVKDFFKIGNRRIACGLRFI